MFVQVVKGTVKDASALRALVDRWQRDLRPGAVGYLGMTGGVSDKGEGIAIVRFESAEAARRNSQRPEQDEWFAEVLPLFDGEPSFKESEDVLLHRGGGSDEAGFVQVLLGKVIDRARLGPSLAAGEQLLVAARPDLLGSTMMIHDDGTYTEAAYFSSEADAREYENKTMSEELQALFTAYQQAAPTTHFIDLKDPWLH